MASNSVSSEKRCDRYLRQSLEVQRAMLGHLEALTTVLTSKPERMLGAPPSEKSPQETPVCSTILCGHVARRTRYRDPEALEAVIDGEALLQYTPRSPGESRCVYVPQRSSIGKALKFEKTQTAANNHGGTTSNGPVLSAASASPEADIISDHGEMRASGPTARTASHKGSYGEEIMRSYSVADFSSCVEKIQDCLLFDPRFTEKHATMTSSWFSTVFAVGGRPKLGKVYYTLAIESLLIVGLFCGLQDHWEEIATVKEYLTLPILPFSLVGGGLMFLVVFRSQTSYAKWDRARALWCQMTTCARDVGMQSAVYMRSKGKATRMCRCLVAYTLTVRCWLRCEAIHDDMIGDLLDGCSHSKLMACYAGSALVGASPRATSRRISSDNKFSWQFSQSCAPLCCLEMLREIVDQASASKEFGPVHMAFDNNIKMLGQCLATFERLLHTKIPFAYISHLRTSVLVYLVFLPLALHEPLGWFAIPACWFIAFVLIGLENLSVEIEDPFGYDYNDLPMDQYCAEIARDVRDILDRRAKFWPPSDCVRG